MKKFTKLFLSCALVSAMAVTAAASAFAEIDATYDITGKDLTGTYTTSSNAITALNLTSITPDAGTQVTFLVYKEDASKTEVAAADVIGIDQNAAGTTGDVKPANSGLKDGSVTETEGKATTYIVKVGYTKGGTFTVAEGKFTVGKNAGILGDADQDEDITIGDAQTIAAWLGKEEVDQTANPLPEFADADQDKDMTIGDAQAIASYLGMEEEDQVNSPIGK